MHTSEARPATPAEQLRERLTQGHGRLTVLIALTCVWLMDWQLSKHLQRDQLIEPQLKAWMTGFEQISTVLFVLVTLGLLLALYQRRRQLLFRFGLLYLCFSVLQVIANVMAMILTAGHHQGAGLMALWDVAAVYMESVLVFMFIYIFLDVSIPGGAFVWPSRDGEVAPEPHLIDYLFISLNVNSTYGPTSEALVSRSAKLVMALQVLMAILILAVLIARSVSSIS